MTKQSALLGLTLAVAACGGSTAAPAGRVTNPARTSGGAALVTQGTGQAVSSSANQRFEEAARVMRQHDEANNGRGDWDSGACDDVAGKFESAANEQPGGAFAEAWFMRAMSYERCNNTDRAREALNRALSVSRGSYCRARVQLGVYQYRAGQTGEALATFQQSIREDQNCVEGYTNLAMMQRERNQTNDAVANIRQALARDDKYIPALNQLALTYLSVAGNDSRSQRLMLAGFVCRQAVLLAQQHAAEMSPEVKNFVADVHQTWGLVEIKAQHIIPALTHFRRAFELNPNMFEAWVNYGSINLSFRGYNDAREAFQHAVQLRPNDYDAHIGLGVALRGLGQAPQAQAEYERAQQLDQNRPDAFYNLGALYENYMGGQVADLQRAKGFYEQFLGKAGNNARYADAVSRARARLRNVNQAITALQAVAGMSNGGGGGAAPAPAPAAGGAAPAAPAGGTR